MKHLLFTFLLFSWVFMHAQKLTFTTNTNPSCPDSTRSYVQDPTLQGWDTKKPEALADVASLEQYTGEYTNVELHVSFRIEVNDQKLKVINAATSDTFSLDETNKDLFTSRGQKFLFQRSMNKKEIIGFFVQTKGLPDKPFVKISGIKQ